MQQRVSVRHPLEEVGGFYPNVVPQQPIKIGYGLVRIRPYAQRGWRIFSIGQVEVVWNTITIILDNHLGKAIFFHDVLHGFQANRGTRTSSLETHLL